MADTAYAVNSSWVQYVGTFNDTLYIQFRNGDCALFYNITGVNADQWVQVIRTASRPRGPGTIVNYDFKFAGQAYHKIPSPVGPILNGAITFHKPGNWVCTAANVLIEAWGNGINARGPGLGHGGAYASSHISGLTIGQTYAINMDATGTGFDNNTAVFAQAAQPTGPGTAAGSIGTTARFSGGMAVHGLPLSPAGGASSAGPTANGANGIVGAALIGDNHFCLQRQLPPRPNSPTCSFAPNALHLWLRAFGAKEHVASGLTCGRFVIVAGVKIIVAVQLAGIAPPGGGDGGAPGQDGIAPGGGGGGNGGHGAPGQRRIWPDGFAPP